MSFRDYSSTPSANTALEGTFTGPNMPRNNVRPALQRLAADGRELYDLVLASAGQKGDPGGDISAVGPFATLNGMAIPAGVNAVTTTGYATKADGGDARYADVTTSSPYAETFTDATGRTFEVYVNGYVSIRAFGAHPTNTPGDNTAAIQKAVNHALWLNLNGHGHHAVIIEPGRYEINNTIICAMYNGSYAMVGISQPIIMGKHGKGYVGSGQKTEIVQTNKNVPAFALQWCRDALFKGFSITGAANDLALPDYPSLLNDATSPWFNIHGARDEVFTPHCGIALDPFGPTVPPEGAYPGLEAYYGVPGNQTTGLIVDDMEVQGFIVGIGLTINYDNQLGDSVIINNCNLSFNKVSVAIGQSQNRGVVINNAHVKGAQVFVDGKRYGAGNAPGPLINGGVIVYTKYLINSWSNWGPGSVKQLYAESTWSMGYWEGGNGSLTFDDCQIKLLTPDVAGGRAIESQLASQGPVIFRGGYVGFYHNIPTPLSFANNGRLIFDGVVMDGMPILKDKSLAKFNSVGLRYESNGMTLGVDDRYVSVPTDIGYADAYVPHCGEVYDDGIGPAFTHYQNIGGDQNIGLDGSVAFTVDGTGGATFTSTDPAKYIVGRYISVLENWAPTTIDGAANLVNHKMTLVGRVASIVGSVIHLDSVPFKFASGSYTPYDNRFPVYRVRTVGTFTNGSPTITGVTPTAGWPAATIGWKVGDYIQGPAIPYGAHVTAIAGTTFTMSHNATASGVKALFDAEMRIVDAYRNAAPTTGSWFAGDFVKNYAVGVKDASNMVLYGWVCTVTGSPGTWEAVNLSAVSPAT